MFHLALHAAREGCHRLVWLKDIELAVAVGQPDLDELVRRAVAARCAPAVGIALARSKWMLGADVPDEIITALVGRVWPRVVKAVAAFDDLGSTSRWPSPGTLLTRETRMSIPRTADWAVRRIAGPPLRASGSNGCCDAASIRRPCTPDELARNELDRAERSSRSSATARPRRLVKFRRPYGAETSRDARWAGQSRGYVSGHWYCSRWRSWASR